MADRLLDWPERLVAAIDGSSRRPFEWGAFDCALFASECVEAVTGIDHFDTYRGRYKTRIGATRLLNKNGGLEAIVDELFTGCDIMIARRGDLVLLTQSPELGPGLAVVVGSHVAAPAISGGLEYVPITSALITRAWRV